MTDDGGGPVVRRNVRFALDGVDYEVELAAEDAERLRSILAPYADKGRRITGRRARHERTGSAGPDPSTSEERVRIRRWAEDNGLGASSRGRIARSVIDAYNARH